MPIKIFTDFSPSGPLTFYTGISGFDPARSSRHLQHLLWFLEAEIVGVGLTGRTTGVQVVALRPQTGAGAASFTSSL